MKPHSRSAQDPIRAAAPGPQALTPTARWALAGLSLSVLPASLGTSIAHVGLPAMATAFDASFQAVQWIVLAYLLALTTLIVSAGRLGDLVGRRRLLLGGILLFTAASLLCAAAPTLGLLIAARAAQGLGAAVMTALAMAFVAGTVPKERVGRAMGLLGSTSAIGTALGPSLGGFLISGVGWQALFLVGVPPGLLALHLVRRHLPCDPPRSAAAPVGFDHPGTLLLALTLGAYALAVTLGQGGFDAVNAALLVAAACGAALFVRVEARAASPLIRPSAFRDPVLGPGVVAGVLVSTVMMTTLVVGPFHLTLGLGLPGALAGLVLASGPVVAALTGVPAGRLADRFGAHRTTVSGLAAMAVGTASLAVLPAGAGVFGYLVPLVVVTAGYAVFQTANNTAVMAGVPADRRGVVSGVLNLSRNLGLITGASVMSAVFAFASGAADITTAGPASVAAGTRITYAVAAGLTVLASAVAAGSGGLVRRRAARRAARLASARRT
ncbi:MFS transporter [Streptomyces sp. Isolate_45]|uniref:MFS transporter n=1 Tax=Streptomyces sp. Isolate_45 TaxID=2950111 RepID=UPI0024819F08|nr:MFS transporter [Streptomyces sp. Isolate_45]MDA5283024.1 MFS transporter [Streptomyces sp. Isolate_45]